MKTTDLLRDLVTAVIPARWWCLLFAIAWGVADWQIKAFVQATLTYGVPVQVFSWWDWTLAHNTGAAFGILSDQGGWLRYFLIIVACVISSGIAIWIWHINQWSTLIVGLSFILGGALGNVVDRFIHGRVVDFISIHFGSFYFPNFNFADVGISIGAILLIFDQFVLSRPHQSASPASEESEQPPK